MTKISSTMQFPYCIVVVIKQITLVIVIVILVIIRIIIVLSRNMDSVGGLQPQI